MWVLDLLHTCRRTRDSAGLAGKALTQRKWQIESAVAKVLPAALASSCSAFEKEAKLSRLARHRKKMVPQANSGDANSTTMP